MIDHSRTTCFACSQRVTFSETFCRACGVQLPVWESIVTVEYGEKLETAVATNQNEFAGSDSTSTPVGMIIASWLVFLLAVFFPVGLHRLIVGRWWTAFFFLLTFAGALVWWIVDIVLIGRGKFTTRNGNVVPPPWKINYPKRGAKVAA